MTVYAKDKTTKENKPTIEGVIKTYSTTEAVPANTYGYNITFLIGNEPEASKYNKFVVLSFAQYTENENSQYMSPRFIGGSNPEVAVPNLTASKINNQDAVTIAGFNSSESEKNYKFEIKILWYNE